MARRLVPRYPLRDTSSAYANNPTLGEDGVVSYKRSPNPTRVDEAPSGPDQRVLDASRPPPDSIPYNKWGVVVNEAPAGPRQLPFTIDRNADIPPPGREAQSLSSSSTGGSIQSSTGRKQIFREQSKATSSFNPLYILLGVAGVYLFTRR